MFSKEKIIAILKEKPLSFKDLARKLNIKISQNRDFSRFLFSLEKDGEIQQTKVREFYAPNYEGELEGIIRLNPKGFGFVDGEEKSFFIAPYNIKNVFDGDEVKIKYFKEPGKKEGYSAIILEVIKRNKKEFVGRVFSNKFGLTIKPFDQRVRGIFVFKDPSKVAIDQEVKVEILEFIGNKILVDVIKILGYKNDVSMDILIAIEDSGIPYQFDEKTLSETKTIPENIEGEDFSNREDFRKKLIITIDGDDTKDFDDAIEITKLENGNYELGVHIADVTHYVKEGNPLDDEARLRGTSVYLADRVIPMLPEKLSNGICSLNPNVDRFTLSAIMEVDKDGNTVNHRLVPSIINSKYRLTYKEVNDFYKGDKSFEDKELILMLNNALKLSHIIRKYKKQEGYIDFEIEESKIVIDDKGKTVDIVARERGESEMMIEDFMVRANETVAKHAFDLKKPFIYRIHDKPDADRIINLQGVMDVLNLNIKIPQTSDPKIFGKAIDKLKESRFDDFMKIMMLRTMAKAVYSPKNIGHFGLASKEYTHFTSPIRRYPDLMVHRMIREYFFNHKNMEDHFKSILTEISSESSLAEQSAVELERKVADIKKAEFYEQFVNGNSMEAKIVSIMKFGMFVEFSNKVDALLHVSNLTDGPYELDSTGYKLTNKRRVFTIGDKLNVNVVGVQKDVGKIDVVLSSQYEEWRKEQEKTHILKKWKNKLT